MYRRFMRDDNDKIESITISDLKFGIKGQDSKHKKENTSKNPNHKIEDKKPEELEKVFSQIKINIKTGLKLSNINGLPEIIYDIKKVADDKTICIIYDSKYFSKKIEIEISGSILFVEKLDNKDLILLVLNGKDYELLVYRLMPEQKNKNKPYFLLQKIKETIEGYKIKYKKNKRRHFFYEEKERKEQKQKIEYNLFYIKAISMNRFFCVSNYGFKMYALNEKKEYELVLLEPYEIIDFIYEIDIDKFIFGLNIREVKGFGFCGNAYDCYYSLFLNKIELKDIDKIENKSKEEKVKKNLKFSFTSQKMLESHFVTPLIGSIQYYFSDFVCLKNKFFIIMINRCILIFNIETGEEIKRFNINIVDNYYSKIDIKNWDCPENDEFIMIVNNIVILFKLNEEDSSKIGLVCIRKIKVDTFLENLKKINTQKNRFYSYNESSNNIIIY